MIDRGVGKAEKNFVCHSFLQCVVLKEIRCKFVCIVAADGTEDHIHLGIAKSGEQIRCPRLGMRPQVCHAHFRVWHVFDGKPERAQAFFADFQLMRDKGFAEHAARQADNSDCFHHRKFLLCFSSGLPLLFRIKETVPLLLQEPNGHIVQGLLNGTHTEMEALRRLFMAKLPV